MIANELADLSTACVLTVREIDMFENGAIEYYRCRAQEEKLLVDDERE
jgi:hypothetical protein